MKNDTNSFLDVILKEVRKLSGKGIVTTPTDITSIGGVPVSNSGNLLPVTIQSTITLPVSIQEKPLPLRYFSTALESGVELNPGGGVIIYSIYIIGSGNVNKFIQIGSDGVLLAPYLIDIDGDLPINFGDGIVVYNFSVTNSDTLTSFRNNPEIKFLFNIAYDLI